MGTFLELIFLCSRAWHSEIFFVHTIIIVLVLFVPPSHREIKILKKLQHKNVISLIETFEDTEKQKLYPFCIVREGKEGGRAERERGRE